VAVLTFLTSVVGTFRWTTYLDVLYIA